MHGTRTQAERDAVTVEIGYALLTGAALAGLSLLLFLGVHVLLPLPGGGAWLMLAGSTSATVFAARVLYVLMRHRAAEREPDAWESTGDADTCGTDACGTTDAADGAGAGIDAGTGTGTGTGARGGSTDGAGGAQPSQPGRTSPDS